LARSASGRKKNPSLIPEKKGGGEKKGDCLNLRPRVGKGGLGEPKGRKITPSGKKREKKGETDAQLAACQRGDADNGLGRKKKKKRNRGS